MTRSPSLPITHLHTLPLSHHHHITTTPPSPPSTHHLQTLPLTHHHPIITILSPPPHHHRPLPIITTPGGTSHARVRVRRLVILATTRLRNPLHRHQQQAPGCSEAVDGGKSAVTAATGRRCARATPRPK